LIKNKKYNIDEIALNHKNIIANNTYCSPSKILNAEKLVHKVIAANNFDFDKDVVQLSNIIKTLCKNDNLICNSILLLIIEKIFIFHKDKITNFHKFINSITAENKNIKLNNSILKINNFKKIATY
jgi:hypothetical protein